MKLRKRLLGALLLIAIVASSFNCQVRAGTYITVLLDGMPLSFAVAPRNINDRVMVPYRAIGEAMGASIYWDDVTRKITLLLGDRYVVMYTGNPLMQYGTLRVDQQTGETIYETPLSLTLDAPPVIIDDYNLVPLRAISEGLGATVEWNDVVKTVYITSAQTALRPNPETPMQTANPEVFEQTNWFSVITGTRAQQMHDNDEQFILVYFSSDDPVAAQYMPELKQIARNYGYRIYGVDAKDDIPGSSDLAFIWDYSRLYNIVYPLVFFVNGKYDITYIFGPAAQNTYNLSFDEFNYKSKLPPATPTPDIGWNGGLIPTPRPSPTPTPNLNAYWLSIGREAADNMYYGDQKFILVYYHSEDDDSKRWLDNIKQASVIAGVQVYAVNAYGYNENDIWWGKSYISNPDFFRYPTVYFVNRRMVRVMEQPVNVETLTTEMRNFYSFY